MTQQELDQAILSVTAGPNWDLVKKFLASEIYNIQCNTLEAPNWDAVVEARGFAKGLAFILNLRESTTLAMQEKA